MSAVVHLARSFSAVIKIHQCNIGTEKNFKTEWLAKTQKNLHSSLQLPLVANFFNIPRNRISFKAGPAYNSVACQNVLTGNALFGWRPHDV